MLLNNKEKLLRIRITLTRSSFLALWTVLKTVWQASSVNGHSQELPTPVLKEDFLKEYILDNLQQKEKKRYL